MSWDQIRELKDAGVTIGSQTTSHPHMTTLDRQALKRELAESNQRFVEELKERPTLFAYPYGEYSLMVRKAVADAGFEAAFGQHSGVAYRGMDILTLPRFTLNERYGGIDRFRLVTNALPLPVSDILPKCSSAKPWRLALHWMIIGNLPRGLFYVKRSEAQPSIWNTGYVWLKQPFRRAVHVSTALPGPEQMALARNTAVVPVIMSAGRKQ